VAAVLAAIGAYSGDDSHATRGFLFVLAIVVVATAIIFYVIVPRVTRLDRGALIFAVVAAVSVVVFWLGLTPLLGGAAALLALGAGRDSARSTASTAALVLAVVAVAAAAVLAFVA
jgi:hypothetical protein